MRKRRVVGRIYGMKYSWKGHKDGNRHKNRIKRSGQARSVSVKDINHNIPTMWRWAPWGLSVSWFHFYTVIVNFELFPVCTMWCIFRTWWHVPRKLQIPCSLTDPMHTCYTWNERKLNAPSCSTVFIFSWRNREKNNMPVENTALDISMPVIWRYFRIGKGDNWWELTTAGLWRGCGKMQLSPLFARVEGVGSNKDSLFSSTWVVLYSV